MTKISLCEGCSRVLIHEEYEEDTIFDAQYKPHKFFVCKDCKEYGKFTDVYNRLEAELNKKEN